MNLNQVAQSVADRLFSTEAAIDDAMIQATGLVSTMIEARRATNVSATTGEVAQARAAEAIAALAEARRAVMASHAALASLQTKMNADIECPDKPQNERPSGVQTGRLRVA